MEITIKRITYLPMGSDHTLQREITDLLTKTLVDNAGVTPAEIGYLHMNSITYVKDHIEVKLYFVPDLALVSQVGINGAIQYRPHPAFRELMNIMYVGEAQDSISYETIATPKYKIQESNGRRIVRVVGPRKNSADEERVVVLNCNLSLVIAAINQVNLARDTNFNITYETVAAANEKGKSHKPPVIISTVGASQEYPVTIHVQHSDESGYNPDAAIPYLLNKAAQGRARRTAQKELGQKISDEAAHLDKKRFNKQFKNYKKYR